MRILIYSILIFILISHIATAQNISFKEQYQDYQGRILDYNTQNLIMFPMYTITNNGNNYIISRMGTTVTIPKRSWIDYKFYPDRIQPIVTIQNYSQINQLVTKVNSSVWYLTVPWSASKVKSVSDSLIDMGVFQRSIKLDVHDSNETPKSYEILPRVIGSDIRLYFNPQTYSDVVYPLYLTENTITVNNATTSAWSTSNITLDGLSWTGQNGGGLRINKNASYLTGLVGSWDLDEDTGTAIHNVNTESGLINTTNQGTWNGNTTLNYSIGRIGNASLFDGINDFISIPDTGSTNITNSITIALTMNISLLGAGQGTVISKGYTGNPATTPWMFYVDSTNVKFYISNGTASSRSFAITANNTYQLVGVYNGSYMVTYTNGIFTESLAKSGNIISSNSNVLIGANWATNYYKGLVDEVRVWNRALSASEISVLYNTSMRTQGNLTISNQAAPEFYLINRTKIVYTGHNALNNISIYARQNGTTTWDLIQENATTDTWYNITNQYRLMDFRAQFNGNGSNTSFFVSLEWDEERIPVLDEYVESTCSDVTTWGTVGFALITVLIIIIAGTIAIGWITGSSPLDMMLTIEFMSMLIIVVSLGALAVAIVSPIFELIGCP